MSWLHVRLRGINSNVIKPLLVVANIVIYALIGLVIDKEVTVTLRMIGILIIPLVIDSGRNVSLITVLVH